MTESERRGFPRPTAVGRLRVTQWVAVTSGVLGLAAVVSLVAGTLAIERLGDARELVIEHLDPAATAALRLSNALVNEETGVRGYALTGQGSFLDPYRAGRREEDAATLELRRLLAGTGNNEVIADLTVVERATDDWQEAYAVPTIDRVRRRGPEAVRRASTERGERVFERVRVALRDQRLHIAAARDEGRRDLDSAASFLTGVFVAVAVLLVLAAVSVMVTLRRTVARPLVALGRGVRRVAQGDFEHALQAGGPRDIADLGADVDSMRVRILDELSQVRAAHARLDRQARELERSNAELEQFAYVASHDLQEPLRKIASFCQLLEQRYKGQLDERADQYIEFAVDGAKRMQQLINDLLAFSRVGRLTGDFELVELDRALARALGNLETAIDESGARIEADPLPAVGGEESLLELLFQNLVGNAIKFRAEGVAPKVSIGVARLGDQWLFSCSDNGIGIEPEYAERVFVIFQRLHAKQDYGGTGIGLAMCRKIVEYHGGRIWLDTDAGGSQGAVFRFTLPALEETA